MSDRILYIEDNKTMMNMLIYEKKNNPFLSSLEIDLAETAEKGMELARNNHYNFIITDRNLHGSKMTGVDIYLAIKQSNPSQEIAIFSGNTIDQVISEFESKKGETNIEKPHVFTKPDQFYVLLDYVKERIA